MAIVNVALDVLPDDLELHSHDTQRGEVRGVESCHLNGRLLGHTVASQKFVGKEDHDLRDVEVARNQKRAKQVVHSIIFQFQERDLTACYYHCLV